MRYEYDKKEEKKVFGAFPQTVFITELSLPLFLVIERRKKC